MASEAIGLGSSLIGGILGRKKAETSTSTTNSTSMPVFSGYQNDLQKTLLRFLRKGIKTGGEPTQAERNSAGLSVNNNFDALFKRLQAGATARGFGESGKFNLDNQGLEIERAKTMQQSEADLREKALQRQLQMLSLATGPAFASPGQHTEGTSTGTTPGQSFGQALGQGIAGAGSDYASQLYFDQLMKKYGYGGGGGNYGYPGDLGGG
ncbi:MAG: hypothetical protein WBV94_09105 [Blastocatellia bacterium]